jgi:hypothetical protein
MSIDTAKLAFVIIPVTLVAGLFWGVGVASERLGEEPSVRRRALAVTLSLASAWMAVTWRAAESGVLRLWNATPPPFALLVVGILCLTWALACTGYGRRLAHGLPLWALVGIQGFRLPLELAMHAMYERGIMPEQMSYSGRNFDIVTGFTALVVAWLVFAGRIGRRLVLIWNVVGLLLVLNVVTIGILSTPRFRLFGDNQVNVFVTYTPFVWLPAVMVLAALAGHLIIFRALSARKHDRPAI